LAAVGVLFAGLAAARGAPLLGAAAVTGGVAGAPRLGCGAPAAEQASANAADDATRKRERGALARSFGNAPTVDDGNTQLGKKAQNIYLGTASCTQRMPKKAQR
jgi:hypothetical protein